MLKADDGFYFGVGAFETINIKNGNVLFFKEHVARINMTLNYLQINKVISDRDINTFIEENNLLNCILKLAVTKENMIFSIRENMYSIADYRRGYQLMFSSFLKNETSPITYHKTLSCAENIFAKKQAAENGYDEVLFINTKGELSEGSYSNIFFINNNKLFTPKVECGILPGVFRQFLCSNEEVAEVRIKKNEISLFDACFITNSIIGIMPVVKIEDHKYSKTKKLDEIIKKYKQFY